MAKKILIIDDEPDIREVAAMSMEAIGGWEVLQASCGADGIRVAETEHPDLILLDVMMPDVDGPGTFSKLRANVNTASIPVVLLTAKVQASDKESFASLGVDGVLTKPFDPITLVDDISRVVGWKK